MIPAPEHLVEAILLVSARPVPPEDLASAAGITGEQTAAALERLSIRYAPESSGVVLRTVAGGYVFSTNPTCAGAVERFREEARPAPLSSAAHEVLACALYLGPLTRGTISRVRGVNSDAVVRHLLERSLLAEVGADRDAPGAPALLSVTDDFLAAADAASREDFPPLATLVSPEELARVRERLTSAEEPAAPVGEG
jgi:segregation and condensation protein B